MNRFAFLALIFCAGLGYASDVPANAIGAESYIHPPKEVEDVVLAPWYRNVVGISNLSPDRTRFISIVSAGLPKLSDMGRPYHNLGGLQVDFQGNRARSLITRRWTSFVVRPLGAGAGVTVDPPKGATLGSPVWSPDGKRIAFYAHFAGGTYLYTADAKTGRIKQVCNWPVLATLDPEFEWLGDSKRLVAVFVPVKRSAMPETPAVATAPLVRVSDNKPNALRTYAGLMNTPEDEAMLEWDTTGQLGVADADTGKVQSVGAPAMINSVSPNVDGTYFRLSVMERPFSYMVPTSNFPHRDVLWDASGKQVVEFSKQALRIGEDPTPAPGAAPTAPRDDEKRAISWRPDGAGLSFLQVAPVAARPDEKVGGESDDEQGRGGGRGQRGGGFGAAGLPPRRDRVMLWVPPYGPDDVKLVYESENRIGSLQYSDDCKTLFLSQTVNGRSQVNAVRLDTTPAKVFTVSETRGEDFYNETGSLLTRAGSKTGSVVRISGDGKFVYFSGTKYFREPEKDAPRPFIDKVEIETGKKERVFESSDVRSETAVPVDDDLTSLLVSRQSPSSISQTFLVNSASKAETQLTENKDYAPDLTQATVRTYKVTRPDGITFQVKVTLPTGTKAGAKLPAFFWFYPSEFVDQATYDRGLRTFNKNAFKGVSVSNKVILLREGYALVEPDCPIIGPADRKNDEYVPQLRNNLAATIDAICEDGTIDRTRLAIGGHSYGAFSTLNALVHTPFFKAGIAGDGNYNRLLTPFGFQSEQRQLWESRDVYLSMSPILYLEQLTGAILLYHGLDDQNMGTDPTNSPRLFQALEALGKNAALYMYPYEDHGQIAQETVLDQWARFVAWLDKWVKNAPK